VREVKDAERLLREAEDLGVPWREILEAEIRAERMLKPFLEGLPEVRSFERLLALLPSTALESWRVRDAIARLSWLARPGSGDGQEARRDLRVLFAYLKGRSRRMPAATLLANHLLLAYRRVQELAALSRCAAKCRGAESERVSAVASKRKCTAEDARWAVRVGADGSKHGLDEAVLQARREGFEIPPGPNATEILLRVRRLLQRRGLIRVGQPTVRRRTPATAGGDAIPSPRTTRGSRCGRSGDPSDP
jgi:hypothetical protein